MPALMSVALFLQMLLNVCPRNHESHTPRCQLMMADEEEKTILAEAGRTMLQKVNPDTTTRCHRERRSQRHRRRPPSHRQRLPSRHLMIPSHDPRHTIATSLSPTNSTRSTTWPARLTCRACRRARLHRAPQPTRGKLRWRLDFYRSDSPNRHQPLPRLFFLFITARTPWACSQSTSWNEFKYLKPQRIVLSRDQPV